MNSNPTFKGTYYLQWATRASHLCGIVSKHDLTTSGEVSPKDKQIIVLADEWWKLYYEELNNMKEEIKHGMLSQDPNFTLSRPKSISILKKIILIRAVAREFIVIPGIIDNYFFQASAAPETQKDQKTSAAFGLRHYDVKGRFYTVIGISSLKIKKIRKRSNQQHTNPVQDLSFNPLVRFGVAGFGNDINSLFYVQRPSSVIFDHVVSILERYTGHIKFLTKESGNFIWGLEPYKGLSLSYIKGLDNDDDFVTSRCGISKAYFFLVEYYHASFIVDLTDEKAHDAARRIFHALEENDVTLSINTSQGYDHHIHKQHKFSYVKDFVLQDRHFMGDEYYTELKRIWAAAENDDKNKILRSAFGAHHVQGDEASWDMLMVLNVNQISRHHYRHVLNTIVRDLSHSNDLSHSKNNVLFVQDYIGDMNLCELGEDLLKFHVYVKTELNYGIRPEEGKILSKQIIESIKQRSEIHKAVAIMLNVLIEDLKRHDVEADELLSQARLTRDYLRHPYAHIIFKRGKDFGVSIKNNLLVICVGDHDIEVVKIFYDLICLFNWLYLLSMENIVSDDVTWRHSMRLCGFENFKEDKLVALLLSFRSIIEWFRFQLFGGEFDHRDVIQRDFQKQKALFQRQKRLLREANRALVKEGHYGEMKIVLSISGVFGSD